MVRASAALTASTGVVRESAALTASTGVMRESAAQGVRSTDGVVRASGVLMEW